jgi:hypothetical protein
MSRKTKDQTAAAESEYLRGQRECGRYSRVSPRTVSEYQRRGIFPYIKIGKKCVLFKKSAIDAALAKFEVAAIG